jgi:hypothetical protein
MLETFASVGATHFTVTWTNLQDQPRRSRVGVRLAQITRAIPRTLDEAIADKLNLIIRPYGTGVWFIQLDDLKADQLSRLAPRILLIIATSPGNHQAWLALEGRHDKEFASRVRRGAGTDKRATGATRIAGSLNFKEKYDPEKTGQPWPRVLIHTAQPFCKTTAAELEKLGLVAPKLQFTTASPIPSSTPARWPSYQTALDNAPLNQSGTGPDRSNADLRFAMTAFSWGFGQRAIAERLMEESGKAREKGRAYADMIAETAARFVVERREPRPRQKIIGHERS